MEYELERLNREINELKQTVSVLAKVVFSTSKDVKVVAKATGTDITRPTSTAAYNAKKAGQLTLI